LSRKTNGEVINIASGRKVSIKEVINKVIKITGGGSPNWGKFPYRKSENMSLYANIKKAHRLLDWKPSIGLDEGLRLTVEYYKKVLY
ncbi:NAD(P)-dependent oxidoreductase, partial [Candidatus Omnitrophota bacterium]